MGEYEQIIEESVCERTKEREWVYVRERESETMCVRESEYILIKVALMICTPIPYQTMLNKHIVI